MDAGRRCGSAIKLLPLVGSPDDEVRVPTVEYHRQHMGLETIQFTRISILRQSCLENFCHTWNFHKVSSSNSNLLIQMLQYGKTHEHLVAQRHGGHVVEEGLQNGQLPTSLSLGTFSCNPFRYVPAKLVAQTEAGSQGRRGRYGSHTISPTCN
jgi:hypothetical protein